jgi:hypothetical protein
LNLYLTGKEPLAEEIKIINMYSLNLEILLSHHFSPLSHFVYLGHFPSRKVEGKRNCLDSGWREICVELLPQVILTISVGTFFYLTYLWARSLC